MMGNNANQKIIVVGCGRVGVELTLSLYGQGHTVSVVDVNPKAFDRLGAQFRGRTVQGESIDQDVLKRAGIETADALAAVTSSDSVNLICARIARDFFHIKHVVARVYNPVRMPIYEKLGLQTVASSSWGAKRMEQLILQNELQGVYAIGHGEVQIYEIIVPESWSGHKISELIPAGSALPVSIVRGGRASLPEPDTIIQTHDLLQVSATTEGADSLRRLILMNGKG